jgi:hypothetical protein
VPITVTVTTTREQTTVYITDQKTLTSTITDLVILTTETIIYPEIVTATEYLPDPNPVPTQDPFLDPDPVIITVTSYESAPTGDPNAPIDPNWPTNPNQPPFDPYAPQQTIPPLGFIPTPIFDPTPFVPGADAPMYTDQPVFDPGFAPATGPSVAIPAEMQAPATCGPNNPCPQATDGSYYCDPQPLCSLGQKCPGLCFPKLGGLYSQPDNVRQAAWDKAMKDGVYRVQLLVREIRTPVMNDRWVTVVRNSTGNTEAVSTGVDVGYEVLKGAEFEEAA